MLEVAIGKIKSAHESVDAKITEEWKIRSDGIEMKFLAGRNIELANRLIQVAKTSHNLKLLHSDMPSNAEFRNHLESRIEAAKEYREIIANTPDLIDIAIEKGLYPELSHINKLMCDQALLNHIDLDIQIRESILNSYPQKKGGPKPKLSLRPLLAQLLKILIDAGRELAVPTQVERGETYGGNEYSFVCAVIPLLEDLGLEFGSLRTVGKQLGILVNEIKASKITLTDKGLIKAT